MEKPKIKKKICRVGILLDSEYLQEWTVNALQEMIENSYAEIDLLIIKKNKEGNSQLSKFKSVIYSKEQLIDFIFNFLEKIRYGKNFYKESIVNINKIPFLKDTEKIYCSPILFDRYAVDLPEDVLEQIREKKIDVLIRRGFEIIRGRILKTSKHGVISYHHGDLRKYRGTKGPTAAFLNGEDYLVVTIQKLNETLDGGEIIYENPVYIGDLASMKDIRNRIFEREAVSILSKCINRLNDPDFTSTIIYNLGKNFKKPRGLIENFKFFFMVMNAESKKKRKLKNSNFDLPKLF